MEEYELVMGMTGWPAWISMGSDNKEDFLNDVSKVFQMGASGELGFWASQYFMQNRWQPSPRYIGNPNLELRFYHWQQWDIWQPQDGDQDSSKRDCKRSISNYMDQTYVLIFYGSSITFQYSRFRLQPTQRNNCNTMSRSSPATLHLT